MLTTTPATMSTGDFVALFRDGGSHSISELALRTGLSRSTVKHRLDELSAIGLVAADGDAVSTGGRPALRYRLRARSAYVVGVDLGASHCAVGLIDLAGELVASRRSDIEIGDGPSVVLDHALDEARSLVEDERIDVGSVAAIAVGLPGPVEHATGRPVNPPIMPGWHDFDVPAHIQRRLRVPVLVDNDANLAALGERTAAWPGTSVLMYIKVATGIGAGVVAYDVLQRGAQGTAGDIGHVRVVSGAGRICRCGNIGCLEAVASGSAVLADLRSQGYAVSGLPGVADLARAGDSVTTQALRAAGRVLGEVLTMCVSLINPSVIVIDGAIAIVGEHLLNGVREIVYSQSTPLATRDLTIAPARTQGNAALLGAGAMAVDQVLAARFVDQWVATSQRPAL